MKLHYRIVGEGQPVIILHGLFGMNDNWQYFAKQLSQNGFACYLVDLRNHGHSPHDAEFSFKEMAADLAEFVRDLSLMNVYVIGHSLGGKAGLQLLIDYPDLCSRLIVVDIAPYSYPVHHREILDALLAVNTDALTSRNEAEKILENGIAELSTRQFLLKNLYRITPDKFVWRFNLEAINNHIDEVGVPTWPTVQIDKLVLFVRGENSGYIDVSRINEIKQWFPTAEFVTIPNAGHWIHADQPGLLLEAVIRFLK